MSNLSEQISDLSNTAEIVENESSYKLSLLQWSKFNQSFPLLILHQLSINPHKVKNFGKNRETRNIKEVNYSEYQTQVRDWMKEVSFINPFAEVCAAATPTTP